MQSADIQQAAQEWQNLTLAVAGFGSASIFASALPRRRGWPGER